MSAPLTAEDTKVFLAELGPLADKIVLVGGQAVSFWANYYLSRDEALRRAVPYTSRDIDFCAPPKRGAECAHQLGVKFYTPKPFEDPTPCTGQLTWIYKGEPVIVDFLGAPFGLGQQDVEESALEVVLGDVRFRVMSPQRCFESRIHNLDLPGYTSPHALKQLRAAIVCAREYVRDVFDASGFRKALKLNERSFRFCLKASAKRAFSDFAIDPFDAVLVDDRLPEPFRAIRYPQMRSILGR